MITSPSIAPINSHGGFRAYSQAHSRISGGQLVPWNNNRGTNQRRAYAYVRQLGNNTIDRYRIRHVSGYATFRRHALAIRCWIQPAPPWAGVGSVLIDDVNVCACKNATYAIVRCDILNISTSSLTIRPKAVAAGLQTSQHQWGVYLIGLICPQNSTSHRRS